MKVNEPRNLMQLGELKPFMWSQAIGLLEVNDLTNPKKVQTPGSKASASIQRFVTELGKSMRLSARRILNQTLKRKGQEKGVWMAEPAVVAKKRVTTVERRTGR